MNSVALATSLRNKLIEGVHRGSAVVVNPDGDVLHSIGDPEMPTFLRSSVKMIQAIPVVTSGAADSFGFDTAELAVCCASHTAADYHVRTVRGMLEKIGLAEKALSCGGHLPEDEEMRHRLIRADATPTAIYNNCSGKHTGMLAACLANDWPIEGYVDQDHPLQKTILDLIAEYSGVSSDAIGIGIDGCSLPTYYMPLRNAAIAVATFMKRAETEGTPDRRILEAISDHPEMVHSDKGYDTELMRALKGRCYAKRGAMGVMMVGIHSEEHGTIGIAAKMENGDNGPMPVVMTDLLYQTGLLGRDELQSLERFRSLPIENWNSMSVGEIRSEVELKN